MILLNQCYNRIAEMPKASSSKSERRSKWPKQHQSFLLDCIKRRSDIIESGQNDEFSRGAKMLAWKDVQTQLIKRYQVKHDVMALKTKWCKLKYSARCKGKDFANKGEELPPSDWAAKVLDIIGLSSDHELTIANSEQGDEDNSERNSANGSTLFSIEYEGSRNTEVKEEQTDDDDEKSEESCSEITDVNAKLESDDLFENPVAECNESEMEASFKKQLYEETLKRLRQEHQMKMDLLKLKCEEEKVKLDILKIQREEAQRRAEIARNEKRNCDQWFSQLNNHSDDYNHFNLGD